MGVGLIICTVGCNDGSCKFCSHNLYRGKCLGCLNGSYGPATKRAMEYNIHYTMTKSGVMSVPFQHNILRLLYHSDETWH